MKELVILSGKGGTGKTSLTGSIAYVAKEKLLLADCDVDASNMHLITSKEKLHSREYKNGFTANVDAGLCTACGICEKECAFDAIHINNEKAVVNEMFCEGCGLCVRLCPEKAISLSEMRVGEITVYMTRFNKKLASAMMASKRERSGKLVSEVKNVARDEAASENDEYIILDGPPGIGCPAIASLGRVDYALLVAEPTMTGYHDMVRIHELIKHFRIKTGLVVNKSDINADMRRKILEYGSKESISLIGEIEYDDAFIEAVRRNITAAEYSERLKDKTMKIWENIKEEIK
jgi:MinD superfamily P-loop ATPase